MRRVMLSLLGLWLASTGAHAAETLKSDLKDGNSSLGQLIADGYEIKAAVQNGNKFVVLLQKDSTAYACEMASLSQSQCGKIN